MKRDFVSIFFQKKFHLFSSTLLLSYFLSNCGDKAEDAKQPPPNYSKTLSQFHEVSNRYNVPLRYLIAVGYLESQLSPKVSSSLYNKKNLEITMGSSAFGIELKELGLDPKEKDISILAQIEAYGIWINSKTASLQLVKSPKTSEEKFAWLWEIATQHRIGKSSRRNTQAIFLKEIIELLNKGFVWKDPIDNTVNRLEPENPQIALKDLVESSYNLTQLDMRSSYQIPSAVKLPLALDDQAEDEDFKPQGIEITHCPFNLSLCIELQRSQKEKTSAELQAHYIIPADNTIVDIPLQIRLHGTPALTSNSAGDTIKNPRLVIMLVGNSGRIVNGIREKVNAAWFSTWQLKRMGEVISDLCANFDQKKEAAQIPYDKCIKDLKFQTQANTALFHWGDIPDFDPDIFLAYATSKEGLEGEAKLNTEKDAKSFLAKDPISFVIHFQNRTKFIDIEQLFRCPNQKTVWNRILAKPIRSISSFTFSEFVFDPGPNGDGTHFFRAKIYGEEGQLIGWDTTKIYVDNFEETAFPESKTCF